MMMDLGFCLIFYLLVWFLIPENGLDSFFGLLHRVRGPGVTSPLTRRFIGAFFSFTAVRHIPLVRRWRFFQLYFFSQVSLLSVDGAVLSCNKIAQAWALEPGTLF